MTQESSRRSFLFDTTKAAGATALVGAAAVGLAACPPVPPGAPAWPYTYTALDVERTRKLGHQSFYAGGCCYGTFDGILRALREVDPEQFDAIPTDMMRYGFGGVVGFGSLCGTLNGAIAAMGLVSDVATVKELGAELLSWYAATPLPSDISNEYAQNGEYLMAPEDMKTDEVLPQSMSGGNLCHMSVTNWCVSSGFTESSVQRAERCARLTGDVAAKAVELLNAKLNGMFVAENAVPSAAASCGACHTEDGIAPELDMTNGKMDCDICHPPHE